METAKGAANGDLMVLAFEGINFTLAALNRTLDSGPGPEDDYGIWHRETSDFAIIELVRIMILSGMYNDTILPVIELIPFWMNKGESVRCYWSENHMAMWMSSSQLLHEHYGWPLPDPSHRKRLIRFLEVHRDFGYYEFLSTTYMRFTLSGLLNLYDFTFDQELKDLAEAAINRMIVDVLRVTTSAGTFFPISGRSGNGAMLQPYQGSAQKVLSILTGLGEFPTSVNGGAAFIATTTFNFSSAISTYSDTVNVVFPIGLTLSQQDATYAGQDYFDKVVFQWSQGAYFDKSSNIAVETFETIKNFDMWESRFFKDYKDFNFLPSSLAGTAAALLECLSGSSLLAGTGIIYRHKNAMLTSMQEYHGGLKGYQQHPLMSTTGTLTIFTQGGEANPDFRDRKELTLNPQLPSVRQVDNVALILYNPHPDLSFFGYDLDGINLYWPEADFDEVVENGRWLFAREGQAYVAVYRHCVKRVNTLWHCTDQMQQWAIVVGHEDLHGGFSNFTNVVSAGVVKTSTEGTCIRSALAVDGVTINGHELCAPLLGPIGLLITIGSILIGLQCVCCFWCCRKKRRVWKSFHEGTSKRTTKAVAAVRLAIGKEKSASGAAVVAKTVETEEDDTNEEGSEETIVRAANPLFQGKA